ncbi:hypothetical protein AB6A40_009176 [Gnathostoma spinigerum]|uniref:hydroxyacylglutathione hydrolase n=1 Tax=Gnathostoma spinigerum TaxID=75299 RepID=A0ABD6ETL1_9BILA
MPSKISLIASIIRRLTTSEVPRMRIIPLPALSDNYMYLLIDEETKNAAIVDPVDVPSILSNVKSHDVQLTAALVTHHHYDHAGGTADLSAAYGGKLPIYAGDARVAKMTKKVVDNDKLKVGNLDITCIFTPCHTSGHICYYVTHNGEKAVFTGDTLFIGGCGRFFEGTAEEMDAALNKKLGSLPDETVIFNLEKQVLLETYI